MNYNLDYTPILRRIQPKAIAIRSDWDAQQRARTGSGIYPAIIVALFPLHYGFHCCKQQDAFHRRLPVLKYTSLQAAFREHIMKVLIVEDHEVVREGVERLLTANTKCHVEGVTDAISAVKSVADNPPDIVILDLNLEKTGGLEVLRRLRAIDRGIKVIIFSMHAEPVYAAQSLKAGARGYVSKSAPSEELLKAIDKVMNGERYLDQDVARRLAISQISSDDPMSQLTPRETEILRLLGQGQSLNDIAESLGVAYKTVANTCSLIKTKLGVGSTADLIRLVLERRLTNL